MRLLLYYPGDLTRTTGTPIRSSQIIKALCNLGARIDLLADVPPTNLSKHVKYHTTYGDALPIQNLYKRIKQLITLIRKINPDIVYGQTHAMLYAQVLACRLTHTPLVIDLHNDIIAEGNFSATGAYIRRLFETLALKQVNGLTVVSQGLKKYYSSLRVLTEVIPGGADTNEFSPNIIPSNEIVNLRNKDSIIVSYAGNFRAYQGIDILLEAIPKVIKSNPNFLFLLIGGDTPSAEEKVRQTITNYKVLKYVHRLGKRPYREIPSLLAASDILVVPRPLNDITRNAFPSKLPEYMAMGKAVIASDVGDAKQLIQSGKTGMLVPPSNPEALAKAILDLKDTTLRRILGENAREFICKTHSWPILGKKIYTFLKATL